MMRDTLLQLTDSGLYCPAGDFYVDPWRPVARAIVTHAHSDHARRGSRSYLCAQPGERVLRTRLGPEAQIEALPFGQTADLAGVRVSLHPAGHILGSAQVRIEHGGEVWVVSGDYKTEGDATCTPFEPVRCHTFITEATFALPIYRWEPQQVVFEQINAWWRANQAEGKCSLLYCYALGKAQRLLSGLDPAIGPIFLHGALLRLTDDYRRAGVALPQARYVGNADRKFDWSQAIVLAPPSAHATPWMRRFGSVSSAFASGWMRIRGTRRRRAVDRGFVLSDHADWPGLLEAIAATGAEQIWVTHGYTAVLARWLQEQGYNAAIVPTHFEGEGDDMGDEEDEPQPDE
jgi:putative mRNA 3-end processing factor